MTGESFDAVILAGGSAIRLEGVDKAEIAIGGMRQLDRCIAAVAGAEKIVVVGPPRKTENSVLWLSEEPPGSGPAAALSAALAAIGADTVVVLAVDLVFPDLGRVARLLNDLGDADGALFVDEAGRRQFLFGCYRTGALRTALAGKDWAGKSLHALLAGLELNEIVDELAAANLNTPDDLNRARRSPR